MTARTMKELLQTVASQAPDSRLSNDNLVPRIRRRRRRRTAIVGVGIGVTVVSLAAGGSFAGSLLADDAVTGQNPPASDTTAFGECGTRISDWARDDQQLSLTADIPTQPLSASQPTVPIEVKVTNRSDAAVDAITSAVAEIAVVKDGVVVSAPPGVREVGVPLKLASGDSMVNRSTVELNGCRSIVISGKIPIGTYDLYAIQRFAFKTSGSTSGPTITIRGGPWRVKVQ